MATINDPSIEELADRIVSFYEIMNDKFDERRFYKDWEPIVSKASSSYAELKRHLSFTEASHSAMKEAVEAIIRGVL